jgi:hypothetical protein
MTKHNSVIVTCDLYEKDKFVQVLDKASDLFGSLVTQYVHTKLNGYLSFFVATDGSKEGWPEAEEADTKRKALCDFIDTFAYADGSSPFWYVDVAYGETNDGNRAYIARSNMEEKAT